MEETPLSVFIWEVYRSMRYNRQLDAIITGWGKIIIIIIIIREKCQIRWRIKWCVKCTR